MCYLIPAKSTCFFYGLIAAIYFLCLANQPVTCVPRILNDNTAHKNGLQAICHPKYRSKYFNDETHRDAVKAKQLFVPQLKKELRNLLNNYTIDPKKIENVYQEPENISNISYDPEKFSNTFSSLKILAEKNDEDSLEEDKLTEFGRKIISQKKWYQKKSRDKNRKRKTSRHGSRYSRWNKRRYRYQWKSNNRRWRDSINLNADRNADYWDQNVCKSFRRIVGGKFVVSAELFPYMVFIDCGCSGGIISDEFVLTAAHCVDEEEARFVHAGSNKLLDGCQYPIVGVWINPTFSRKNIENDVALVKVNPPFVWSPAIQPIRMSSEKAVEKTCGVVAGWGALKFGAEMIEDLFAASLPIVQRKKCYTYPIRKSQFCVGYDDGGVDTCQGDSGAPFVVNGYLVGIVSYGYECARPQSPGVYEDVSYHQDWIRETIALQKIMVSVY